jgi:ribosomal-protein-alanine N-acetyltransferase
MNLALKQIQPDEDKTNEEYASEDCQLALKMWEEYYPKIGFHPPWLGYFTMLEKQIVGTCGFTGPPSNNTIEVSYWTFKEFEGRGIGTAACKELISIARKTDPGLLITAKTAPENNASTTILERCGFVFTGIVQDHEIGDAWEWRLI